MHTRVNATGDISDPPVLIKRLDRLDAERWLNRLWAQRVR